MKEYATTIAMILWLAGNGYAANEHTSVYVEKSQAGSIRYSDHPSDNSASPVSHHTGNIVHLAVPKPPVATPPAASPTVSSHPHVTIITPEPNEAIRANDGNVTVLSRIDKGKKPNYRFRLFLDEQATGQIQRSPIFHVQQISRGEHQLQVRLVNTDGQTLSQSAQITFYVLRHSQLSRHHQQ